MIKLKCIHGHTRRTHPACKMLFPKSCFYVVLLLGFLTLIFAFSVFAYILIDFYCWFL